jgi:transposase
MANKVISMQQIRLLLQLLEKGFSLRSIASQIRLSRQTVTLYAEKLTNSDLSFVSLRELSDTDLAAIVYSLPVVVDITENARLYDFTQRIGYFILELKRTGVTRQLLWEEYRKEYENPYRYTQFCILLKQTLQTASATMHLSHAAAEMVMVDFAGDKMSYVNKSTGEIIACPVLIAVLPYSNYTFAMALVDATIPQVIKALNACLLYFGGVPLSLKTDNMKQVVTKSCRYEPLFSEALQKWSLHYNITLLATRVAKPKDKANVENEVKIAYQRIYAPLRDTHFYDLNQLNQTILIQLNAHNEKLFQQKDHSRKDQFEKEERLLLQPLPATAFELKHQVTAKVQRNYHITLGENYHHYSVPYMHIGKNVSVVYDTDLVEIYYQHTRIAMHPRSYKKHGFTTTESHMPSGHLKYHQQKGYTPIYFLDKARLVGPAAYNYMDEVLKSRAFTEQTYNGCRGILRLSIQYGSERLEAACRRALKGNSFNYRTIENILIANHDLLADENKQFDLFSLPDHQNLRGPAAYE